jgi:hypothetical protein
MRCTRWVVYCSKTTDVFIPFLRRDFKVYTTAAIQKFPGVAVILRSGFGDEGSALDGEWVGCSRQSRFFAALRMTAGGGRGGDRWGLIVQAWATHFKAKQILRRVRDNSASAWRSAALRMTASGGRSSEGALPPTTDVTVS